MEAEAATRYECEVKVAKKLNVAKADVAVKRGAEVVGNDCQRSGGESEGRGCLQEGRLGVPGVLPDIFRTAIFPRK